MTKLVDWLFVTEFLPLMITSSWNEFLLEKWVLLPVLFPNFLSMVPRFFHVSDPAAAPSGWIVFQPPTVPISEAEKARKAKQNATRKLQLEKQRQREWAAFMERKSELAAKSWVVAASSATAACVSDFSAADREAALAWAAAEARAVEARRATEAPAPAPAAAAEAEGKAEAEEEEAGEAAEAVDEEEEAEAEAEEAAEAAEAAETAEAAEAAAEMAAAPEEAAEDISKGGHFFGDVLDRIITFMLLEGDFGSFCVSRVWHAQSVECALCMPRPEGRLPRAMKVDVGATCPVCMEPFSSLCRPTVMLSCPGPHVHCYECIAKHGLQYGMTTCDSVLVACPMCRTMSTGVQVCGMAGGVAWTGKGSRVLLPGDVVGFADIRRMQHGRVERDREEALEAERRDRAAFEALRQALATAQPPLDVGVWWCTLGAEVAALSGSLTAGQLRGLANHVGALSARHVSVGIEVLSLASDDILRRCLSVEVRTADVVLRELERRARAGGLRVTAATAQAVIDRRTVEGRGKRVRTQTPPFIAYS